MKKLLTIAFFALGAFSGQAATAISLQGNLNTGTGNINFTKPTETVVGEARVYDNDFSVPLLATGAVSAGGSYTGPNIYGALRHSRAGGAPATFTTFRYASADQIQVTPGSTSAAEVFDFLYVFKQADFANGLNTGSVGFGMAGTFAVTTAVWNANTKSVRAVVLNNGTWYISQTENTGNNGGLTILSDAASAMWGVWDPLTDISTLPGSFPTAGSTFQNIQAVGVYGHLTKTDGGTTIATTLASINVDGLVPAGLPPPKIRLVVLTTP